MTYDVACANPEKFADLVRLLLRQDSDIGLAVYVIRATIVALSLDWCRP